MRSPFSAIGLRSSDYGLVSDLAMAIDRLSEGESGDSRLHVLLVAGIWDLQWPLFL